MGAQKKETSIKKVPAPKKVAVRWYYNKFFKYVAATLLVLMALLALYQAFIFFIPIFNFIFILFVPIIISLLLYYLLRPIVYFFEKFSIPRIITILFIFLVIAILIVIFIAYIGPIIANQISAIANTSMQTLEKFKESSESFLFHIFHVNLDYEIRQRIFNAAQQITTVLSKNIIDFLSFTTRIAAIFAVIPFILFYLLKDDHNFASAFLNYFPENIAREGRKILQNMDAALSNYIYSVLIVSSALGVMLFIGYLIIGLDYALILAMIAMIFTTIPFLGPFLAITPALIIGLFHSTFMVVKVFIVFVIIQQCESNVISPQIIGHRLNIHPLTIILLLLASGLLFGLVGLIFATPVYVLLKVLVENLYKIYQLHYSHWK
jgi:predicted PurR-regulated permease PerM